MYRLIEKLKITYLMVLPIALIAKIFNKLRVEVQSILVSFKQNVIVEGRIRVIGFPIIDVKKGCKVIVGDNVTLNSRNKGYHLNMHSPVKIFADKPGAIIKIGDNSRVHGTCIHAYESILIGKNCLFAANCHIIDCSGHDLSFCNVEERLFTTGKCKPVTIEDGVWVGANSFILPGVTIGKGSIISANSVVVKDIPPMVIAGGNPAVIIKDFRKKNR